MTDSSTVEEQTVDPAATENTDVNAADSSSADDVETSMLDTVKAVLAGSEDSSASGEQDPDTSDGGAADVEPEGDAEADVSTEEDPEFSDNANKRIRQINAQKKELLTENDVLKSENGQLKAKADRFDAITSFMETASLEPSDVDNGFEIMALLKQGDMVGAYQRLAPIWEYVSQAVGASLPPDLQEQVQMGYMTQENARQLSQTRYAAQANADRAQREQARREARDENDRVQKLIGDVRSAVDDWFSKRQAKDPDWKLKERRIVELVENHCLKVAMPKSAEEAVEIAENALKTVNSELLQFRPKPKSINPLTGTTSNPGAKPEPKSMLDVVKMNAG